MLYFSCQTLHTPSIDLRIKSMIGRQNLNYNLGLQYSYHILLSRNKMEIITFHYHNQIREMRIAC